MRCDAPRAVLGGPARAGQAVFLQDQRLVSLVLPERSHGGDGHLGAAHGDASQGESCRGALGALRMWRRGTMGRARWPEAEAGALPPAQIRTAVPPAAPQHPSRRVGLSAVLLPEAPLTLSGCGVR